MSTEGQRIARNGDHKARRKAVMDLASTPAGLMLLASTQNVFTSLEHSEKHIGQAHECLRIIEGERGAERIKAVEDLKMHLVVIKSDMERALNCL